jgi:hypothetical protein
VNRDLFSRAYVTLLGRFARECADDCYWYCCHCIFVLSIVVGFWFFIEINPSPARLALMPSKLRR